MGVWGGEGAGREVANESCGGHKQQQALRVTGRRSTRRLVSPAHPPALTLQGLAPLAMEVRPREAFFTQPLLLEQWRILRGFGRLAAMKRKGVGI